MKKIIFLVIVSISLLGCIQMPDLFPEDLSGFKDCGDDDACIEAAFKNCEKAFAAKTVDDDSGLLMAVKLVVYGLEQDKCRVKFKIEKVEIPGDVGDAEPFAQFFVSLMQGKEMVCLLPPEEASAMIDLSGEEVLENCTGSLIDTMKTMKGIAG